MSEDEMDVASAHSEEDGDADEQEFISSLKTTEPMTRGSRSTKGKRLGQDQKRAALLAIQKAKQGARRTDQFQVVEEEKVFVEVTEEEFQKKQAELQAAGNFVVDEDGEAAEDWLDNGGDIWDQEEGDGPMRKQRMKIPGAEIAKRRAAKRAQDNARDDVARQFLAGAEGKLGNTIGPENLGEDDIEAMLANMEANPMGEVVVDTSKGAVRKITGADVAIFADTATARLASAAQYSSGPTRLPATRYQVSPMGQSAYDVAPPMRRPTNSYKQEPMDIAPADDFDGDDFAVPDPVVKSEMGDPASKKRRLDLGGRSMVTASASLTAATASKAAAANAPASAAVAKAELAKDEKGLYPQAPERESNVSSKKGGMKRRAPAAKAVTAAQVVKAANLEAMAGDDTRAVHPMDAKETEDSWSAIAAKLDSTGDRKPAVEPPPTVGSEEIPFESNGDLRMFWLDACEDRYNQKGVVFLFGKIQHPETKAWGSACAVISQIPRVVYVVPRVKMLGENGLPSDRDVDRTDVAEEMREVLDKHKVNGRITWFWTDQKSPAELAEEEQRGRVYKGRKYCFERPGVFEGTEDATEERHLLVVEYDFNGPQLPETLSGRSFSAVFGTSTSALEQFILQQRLMGPAWVTLQGARAARTPKTWCKFEVELDDYTNVLYNSASEFQPAAPPLKVLALSMKTVLNTKTHANEVVLVSAITHSDVSQDSDTPDFHKGLTSFSAVRKLTNFPYDFMPRVQNEKRGNLTVCQTERELLNFLMAKIGSFDPDVVVGHNFLGFDLDVLLHRMSQTKVSLWSKLGRRRLTKFPKLQSGAGGTGESTYEEKNVMSGRLICDTWLGAKDYLREKNYSLTNLAETALRTQRQHIDMADLPGMFDKSDYLLQLVQHTENDAFLCLRLMFHLQLIPLSKVLSQIAGNLWSRSLTGGRAERVEYLLLHEFFNERYLVPDKRMVKAENKKAGGKRAKAAYAGGLVLEPKKGFYDKFVMLLDFNSLYPSIIQEHNLCFTTCKRDKIDVPLGVDSEAPICDVPPSGGNQGVLPRILASLVERRRQVKALMKNQTNPQLLMQYEIRQKALKLTANSMYGCLGFVHSRFYCKPIASLITSKGRETLQATVELAMTQLNLEVIYGDTDSVMIHTNTNDLAEVKSMGNNMKKEVNKKYKTLTIDIDGIYSCMLLLKKKKYAALEIVEHRDGSLTTKKVTKGLDLVRRDWCDLSRDAGNYVLDRILSGVGREEVVEAIHTHLRELSERVRSNQVSMAKFIISKNLTKEPDDYADASAQPHVQVAKRMRSQGMTSRMGDVVQYIIVKGDEAQIALRARHPDEVLRAAGELQIDYDWYLGSQVHPPVSRLCDVIAGTDAAQLADCLGIDAAKYKQYTRDADDDDVLLAPSRVTDEERYKNCSRLRIKCLACRQEQEFRGLFYKDRGAHVSGLMCSMRLPQDTSALVSDADLPPRACGARLHPASVSNAITLSIRKHLERYYDAWYVCDDDGCHNRTRQLSLRGDGRTCLVPKCTGTVHPEYSSRDLYSQLMYFMTLVDEEHALRQLDESPGEAASVRACLSEEDSTAFKTLKKFMEGELGKCSHYFVQCKDLFSFFGAKRDAPRSLPTHEPERRRLDFDDVDDM